MNQKRNKKIKIKSIFSNPVSQYREISRINSIHGSKLHSAHKGNPEAREKGGDGIEWQRLIGPPNRSNSLAQRPLLGV